MKKEYKTSTTLKREQEYTFSVETSLPNAEVDVYIGLDYFIGRTVGQKITFEVNRVVTSRDLIVDTGSGGDIIERVKLEKGSKATDWTPAPEDDREYIESQFEITNEEISSKVSSTDFNGNTIASLITQTPSAISLVSRNIDLTGKVTFNSFSTATENKINGIESKADSAKTVADSAYSRAGSAYSRADTAYDRADGARTIIDNWRVTGTTEIDGGNIRTDTLHAGAIRADGTIDGVHFKGGTMQLGYDATARDYAFEVTNWGNLYAGLGGFRVPWNSDGVFNNFSAKEESSPAARWKRDNAHYIYQDNSIVRFYQSGASFDFKKNQLQSVGGKLDISSTNGGNINLIPSSSLVYVDGELRPWANNKQNLGGASYRWKAVYLAGGGINESSDLRLKSELESIPEELIEEFIEVEPKMYEMDGQIQFGYIAQDVERALYKYVLKKHGPEVAKKNKELYGMVGIDESYLSLVYRQVSAIKEAEHKSEVESLKKRLDVLESKK